MEKQFTYLTEKAKEYDELASNEAKLLKRIFELNEDVLQQIFEEYASPDNKFAPVNMLRAKAAKLLQSQEITVADIDEIKDKIRNKDRDFFSEFPDVQLDGLEAYTFGKRDIFANWQSLWSIFHQFFFRGTEKQTIQQYLGQIAKGLISDLDLTDYQHHQVDFLGASNFGSTEAWIALYPIQKLTHRTSYQFFIRFTKQTVAGFVSGDSVEKKRPKKVKNVSSYDEASKALSNHKQEIVKLNDEARNYFKFNPGAQAEDWNWFFKNSCIGVNYDISQIGDLTDIKSLEELNEKTGVHKDSVSGQTWNAWLFKTANIDDIVFVNLGRDKVLGVGVITGDYKYIKGANYPHQREVNWLTNNVYEYKSRSHKNRKYLFKTDGFSPTQNHEFILSEYVRLYPDLTDQFDKHELSYIEIESFKQGITEPEPDTPEEINNYWWMNANPKMWSISDFDEGDRQTYTARNERGNKRRIYKYFEQALPGDLIIGYESTPVKQIRAIMHVTKSLHHSDEKGEVIEFEITEKLEVPVHWDDLKHDPQLSQCEVFINNQGSLFSLTEDEYEVIQNIIDEKNIAQEQKLYSGESQSYSYNEDPDKPFIPEKEFEEIHSILERKKNIILQGPPGVGKTFIARKLAYHHMGKQNDAQIEMVQFHQSYSYEDFVQGLRLTGDGTEVRNGIFYSFCQQAHAHPKKPFFLIVDEINRGNLSKIFGELLMLIENDKRSKKFATKLTYAIEKEDTFHIPENVYLIGTMNTADRSLAIIDYALRRRFAFINLRPIYDEKFKAFLRGRGMSEAFLEHICQSITSINQEIEKDPNLGSGFQIGHSYFCSYKNEQNEADWFRETLQYEIKPLLEEIWFDNLDRAESMVSKLIP